MADSFTYNLAVFAPDQPQSNWKLTLSTPDGRSLSGAAADNATDQTSITVDLVPVDGELLLGDADPVPLKGFMFVSQLGPVLGVKLASDGTGQQWTVQFSPMDPSGMAIGGSMTTSSPALGAAFAFLGFDQNANADATT